MTIFANNKRALFKYQILEEFEAGIALNGQEVKSIKGGRIILPGSYVIVRGAEVYLIGAQIPAYQPKNAPKDYDGQRIRKLLLKKSEINYLIGKTQTKGLTLIPLKIYSKKGIIKVVFGLGKVLKKYDKREKIKDRDVKINIARALKE
ncbi:MAG: SsrA-binding protein SmpB [Patescibacteria group bacterium]